MMDVDVLGIGAWAAAYRGWPALRAAFFDPMSSPADPSPATRPSPTLLPPAERRRAPDGVAVALEVASEAVAMAAAASTIDPTTLATVFASAHGDLAIVDHLCTTLATDPTALSPTRFHLSVHNAAAGNWSIAARDHAPSTALAGGDDTFALGLLEAATMATAERRPVLLVAFDTPAVGLLAAAAHNTALFGFAMIVAPTDPSLATSACLSLAIEPLVVRSPAPRCDALQSLAASSPAARAVALAEALALDRDAFVGYPLGPAMSLSVGVRHRRDPDASPFIETIE
jgi:hypothetical protein